MFIHLIVMGLILHVAMPMLYWAIFLDPCLINMRPSLVYFALQYASWKVELCFFLPHAMVAATKIL